MPFAFARLVSLRIQNSTRESGSVMSRSDETPHRTLAIIGAGRVARGLGARLREAGWRIAAVAARHLPAARAAVRSIGAGIPCAVLSRRVFDAPIILLAIPDDALAAVASQLAERGGADLRRKIILHTSGALSSAVLAPLARHSAWTGVIHPMQSFAARSRPRLDGVLFGIEGHSQALRVIRRMVRSVGGEAVRIEPGRKVEYHCAGTFAAAHVLASVEAGVRLLAAAGMKRREATRALLRLARQVLDNQEVHGPRAAWTGPLSRRDLATIRLHWDALGRYPDEFRQAYSAMTRLAARLLADAPDALLEQVDSSLAAASAPEPPREARAAAAASAE